MIYLELLLLVWAIGIPILSRKLYKQFDYFPFDLTAGICGCLLFVCGMIQFIEWEESRAFAIKIESVKDDIVLIRADQNKHHIEGMGLSKLIIEQNMKLKFLQENNNNWFFGSLITDSIEDIKPLR